MDGHTRKSFRRWWQMGGNIYACMYMCIYLYVFLCRIAVYILLNFHTIYRKCQSHKKSGERNDEDVQLTGHEYTLTDWDEQVNRFHC